MIVIRGNLTPWQLGVANSLHRFAIVRAGRRTGKTVLAVYLLLKYAIQHPGSLVWYCALDIATLNELVLPQLEKICPPELWSKKNKQTRIFTLKNGSIIALKTLDSGDGLRGRSVDFMVLEEAAFANHLDSLWQDILSPQLMGRGGRALFISSPNGSNYFRRLEIQALEEIRLSGNSMDCEWSVHTGNIYDNPYIPREEIERKRRITPEETWEAEFCGRYVDSIGLVYWDMDPARNLIDCAPKLTPVYNIRGMDFGIADNTACAWIAALPNNKAYIFKEHSSNNLDVLAQANIIKDRTSVMIKYSVLDSACWAIDASMTSVAKRFCAAGIPVNQATRDFNGSVSDMKLLLSNGDILIDRSCTKLIENIQSWQHGQHEPDILAATRYGIASLIKAGRLIPPIRKNRPFDIIDYVRNREENARLSARALAMLGRGGAPKQLAFRFYDSLGK
jgi:hypothetical protein